MADTIAKNKTAKMPKYSYKYVDIAQIHEYLESIGASYYQYTEREDGDDYVVTVKIIDGVEHKPLRGARIVNATLQGVVNPAQEQGSALTYARRYSLLMAFGLATTDDDAQALTRPKEEATWNKDGMMTPLQKVKLKALMTDEQWLQTVEKNGEPNTWTSEQAEKWISALERRNNA